MHPIIVPKCILLFHFHLSARFARNSRLKLHNFSPMLELNCKFFTVIMQVHPYTYRNENKFLHLNFNQDPYEEYDYWINKIGVDALFTDFTGSLHNYQEWRSLSSNDSDDRASKLLHKIAEMINS